MQSKCGALTNPEVFYRYQKCYIYLNLNILIIITKVMVVQTLFQNQLEF